jgi:hypothetical protein
MVDAMSDVSAVNPLCHANVFGLSDFHMPSVRPLFQVFVISPTESMMTRFVRQRGDVCRGIVTVRQPFAGNDPSHLSTQQGTWEHARVILTQRAQAALFSGRTRRSLAGCRGSQVRASRHSHYVCAEICMVLR